MHLLTIRRTTPKQIAMKLATPEVVSAILPEDKAECPGSSDFHIYMAWNEQVRRLAWPGSP
jgi:hypothetical protein